MTATASKRLWDIAAPGADLSCRLSPVCGGVELVVERGGLSLVREIHPDHSTAYERARSLRTEYERILREPPHRLG